MVNVIKSDFLSSASKFDECIPEGISEVVMVGRSNVGKSSLINFLTSRKQLAKSSSSPGKTRLINFFDIVCRDIDGDYNFRLVDLPGYGYAKVSKSVHKAWKEELNKFISERLSIRVFLHLRDARHPNLDIDVEVANFLGSLCRPDQKIIEVFTKSDTLNQSQLSLLRRNFPHSICISSTKKIGSDKLWKDVLKHLFGV